MEGDLLGLGEEVRRVAVQGHAGRSVCTGTSSSGTSFVASSRSMPSKYWSSVSGITCTPSSHSGNAPGADRVVEVAAVEVGIDAGQRLRFLPHEAVHAEDRLPVELHQRGLAVVVRPAGRCERRSPPSSGSERGIARSDIAHISMCGDSGMHRDEVPERRVRGLGLRDLPIGFGLGGVDQVGELDAVTDEEHRDVVADEIEARPRRCRTSPRSRARRARCRPNLASRRRSRTG